MSKYILSTMANSVGYALYQEVGGLPTMVKKIQIHGGANMPSVRSGFGEMTQAGDGTPMWTAAGVVTPVSDEDYSILENHNLFKKHIAKGYLKVINNDITGNHKAVQKQVVTMNKKDDFGLMDQERLGGQVKTSLMQLSTESQYT